MTRLPSVAGRGVLQRARFTLDHVTGSHDILIGPSGQRVSVPVHAGEDVPPGTLPNIIRQAGRTVGEFAERL